MSTKELTEDQQVIVREFGEQCGRMFAAMAALESAGVEIADALKALPGHEEGVSLYDELPSAVKMLI